MISNCHTALRNPNDRFGFMDRHENGSVRGPFQSKKPKPPIAVNMRST